MILRIRPIPRTRRPDAVVGVIPNLGGGLAAAYHAAANGDLRYSRRLETAGETALVASGTRATSPA